MANAQAYPERPGWNGGWNGETARNILSVLFKWKWLIIGAFCAVFLPIAITSLSKPAMYQARATVIVKQDRASLKVERVISDKPVTRQTLASEAQIIKSREVMERVVKELNGASNGNSRSKGPSNSKARRRFNGLAWGAAPEPSDVPEVGEAVLSFQRAVVVTPITDANLLQISFASLYPEKAVRIVNKVADVYLEQHAAINRPEGAFHFFERQTELSGRKLKEAEERLKEFEWRTGIVDPDKEIKEGVSRIGQLEQGGREAALEIAEVKPRVAFLKEEVKRQPARIVTLQEAIINPAASQLHQRHLQLELELKALLELYTEKDRRVLAKLEEIEAVQTRLAAEPERVLGREDTHLNDMRVSLEKELVMAQARLESLLAKQQAHSHELAVARQHLARLGQQSLEYQQFKQAAEDSRKTFVLYQQKSEDARISETMDREKLLNVGIVERAALPLEAANAFLPSLLMAAFAGIATGVGGAFGIEFFNTSLKSARAVEASLGLPVLATIERF